LLSDGAQRASVELREQPEARGDLLLAVARLQVRAGRFEDALALLDAVPPGDARLAPRLGVERARALLGLGRAGECVRVLGSLVATSTPDALAKEHARLLEQCRHAAAAQ
jgi:hypothetical protein